MELYRNGLKLTATKGLDESRGSVNVPVKLSHNPKDEYLNYTEQIHIRFFFDNQVKEEILPTNDTGFYIPGKPLSHDGPIELAVHLINGNVELVTNELSFVVKNAPNGTTHVDPSEFTWQQLVDQYVNAKLDTFANKSDLSKFEEKVNGSVEKQNKNFESFKTEVNTNLDNQNKKITDLQTTTKTSLDSQSKTINDFKAEVNTNFNQTTSTQNSKITTLESRMDTFTSLKEGSTAGDAELQDIRVGSDGTKYPSAGKAVREQVGKLKEDLSDLWHQNFVDGVTVTDGEFQNKDGTLEDSPISCVTDYILIEPNTTYKAKNVLLTYSRSIYGFKSNKTYVGSIVDGTEATEVEFTTPNDCRYIRISGRNGTRPVLTYADKIINKEFDKTNTKIEKVDDVLKKYNTFDALLSFGNFDKHTHNGITFEWDNDKCRIYGTSTVEAFNNLYYDDNRMPDGISLGDEISIDYSSTFATGVAIAIGFYVNGSWEQTQKTTSFKIKVPNNATGMFIRQVVYSGKTVNGYQSISVLTKMSMSEVEAKFDDIDNTVYDFNSVDVLRNIVEHTSKTQNGVTFAWNNDKCTVTGKATGLCLNNLYYSASELPNGIIPDNDYYLNFEVTDTNIIMEYLYWIGEQVTVNYIPKSDWIHIPKEATGIAFRINIYIGRTVNGTFSNVHLFTALPNVKRPKPIPHYVSFVDDDAWTDDLMLKYYNACMHNGIKGNFAVITGRVQDGFVTSSKYLDYEDKGFGMLIHCWEQTQDFEPKTRNIDNCRSNMLKAMRQMREYGLVNYKYWIAPGGHVEDDIRELAKFIGVKCLVSTMQTTYNKSTDGDRFFIKRVGGDHGLTDELKSYIDKFVSDENGGWLVITTHFNSDYWHNQTWNDTLDSNSFPIGYDEFNKMVKYVLDSKCEVLSFPIAFENMKPTFIN